MEVVFMGTASAAGSVERDNTYLMLRHREAGWMIDVGGDPLGKLKQLSMTTGQVRGAVITHFHVDHIYGLPSLLWGMWIAGRTEPFTIYCSETGEAQLRAILDSFQVAQWPIKFGINVRTFDWTKPAPIFEEDGLAVSVFPSLHAVPTVGIKAECAGKVLIYSSDTRPNEWIRDQPRVDLLIHEATDARGTTKYHTSLEGLVRFYSFDRIGRLAAVHLTDREPYPDVLAECGEEARSKILIAEDMQVVSL